MATLCVALAAPPVFAEDVVQPAYAVSVRQDVVYGPGTVGASSGKPHARDLKLDLYQPLAGTQPMSKRPAVILAFGGAFHRGSKGTDHFEEDGASDTPMGDYCHAIASAGYVCASIEYRLLPEDPPLPAGLDPAVLMPKALLKNPAMTGRIDVVRGRMGLPPLDDVTREQLWNTVFAAAQDMTVALSYLRANAAALGIDPDRIAVGGFSAGGLVATNVAYGAGVPVQAVISLSGGLGGYDLRKTVRPGMPPGLFVVGQNDLEGIQLGARTVPALLTTAGIKAESAWMPGFGHFYPMGATSLGSDMSKLTLEARVLRFLERTIGDRAGASGTTK